MTALIVTILLVAIIVFWALGSEQASKAKAARVAEATKIVTPTPVVKIQVQSAPAAVKKTPTKKKVVRKTTK